MAERPKTTRVPLSRCRRCGSANDAASGANTDEQPTPGSVSICIECGTVSLFNDDLTLRAPTLDELKGIINVPEIAAVLWAMWNTELAQVTEDDQVLFACGCKTTSGEGLFTLYACNEVCAAAQMIVRLIESEGKMAISVIR